jgi:hypothetical protein
VVANFDDLFGEIDDDVFDRSREEDADAEAQVAAEGQLYAESCVRMIGWLASLPAETEIGWNSRHLSPERPFSTHWIDVEVPLLCRQADWNWAWTIERPWFERSAESELFSLAAEFDAVLEMRPSGEPCYEFGALDFAADRIRLRCPNGALHDYDPARCDPPLLDRRALAGR